ncbi:hypothetical protein FACS1894130_08250 [Spirochaetia bacterium]|nr:hypothetical protein FACS1894130_08250 [Spirochaetia bacterium]
MSGTIETLYGNPRSMASYSLLLTYSGFSFDMTRGEIGFAPIRFLLMTVYLT